MTGDLHVVVAASEQGFRETALEACLLAKEKLQAIREELLRPEPGIADPRYGDDRLQKMSTGSVRPESFTHGSSQQRMRWFNTGLNNETIAACNTFVPSE